MNHQQVLWASRRGMLELDILLEGFSRNTYPQLSKNIQQCFQQFLNETDQDLFDWLLKKKVPEYAHYIELIELIHTSNKDRNEKQNVYLSA